MLKTGLMVALILGVSAFSMPAEAQQQQWQQQQRGTQQQQDACGRDVNRFCRRFINDSDFAILGCLQQNRKRISRGCDRMLREHGQ